VISFLSDPYFNNACKFSLSTLFFSHSKWNLGFFCLVDGHNEVCLLGYFLHCLCRKEYHECSWSVCDASMAICGLDPHFHVEEAQNFKRVRVKWRRGINRGKEIDKKRIKWILHCQKLLKLSHQLLLGLILYLLAWLHRQLSIVKVSQMCRGILPNKILILRRRLSAITMVIWLNIWLEQVGWGIIW